MVFIGDAILSEHLRARPRIRSQEGGSNADRWAPHNAHVRTEASLLASTKVSARRAEWYSRNNAWIRVRTSVTESAGSSPFGHIDAAAVERVG